MEEKTGLTLSESQREAVRLAPESKVVVITGGPGVGKTTLVNGPVNQIVYMTFRFSEVQHYSNVPDQRRRYAAADPVVS